MLIVETKWTGFNRPVNARRRISWVPSTLAALSAE